MEPSFQCEKLWSALPIIFRESADGDGGKSFGHMWLRERKNRQVCHPGLKEGWVTPPYWMPPWFP